MIVCDLARNFNDQWENSQLEQQLQKIINMNRDYFEEKNPKATYD